MSTLKMSPAADRAQIYSPGTWGIPYRGEYRQAAKRAAADIEGHSEAAKFGQP